MKVGEEVDALETMGLNPIRLVVVPKLLAMLVMVPCLDTLIGSVRRVWRGFFRVDQ
jgi:phospholipid/cholesterol/gamma-HCH transport system permease protein